MTLAVSARLAGTKRRSYERMAAWPPEMERFLIETYSTLSAKQQAEALKLPYHQVIWDRERLTAQGKVDPSKRAYHRPWTREEDAWLEDNYHRYTMRHLMRVLGRTELAILNRKRKLGIVRTDGFYTAKAAGELLGCHATRIADLVREGYLKGKSAPYLQGKHRPWVFSEEALRRFVQEYPWLVQRRKVPKDSFLLPVLEEEWRRDPWYDSKQAAQLLGVNEETVLRRLRSGDVPAFQRSPGKRWSRWWVRRSALLAHFRLLNRGEPRSEMTRRQLIERRRRAGLPVKVSVTWSVLCHACGEEYRVEVSPKMRGPQVLDFARQQHACAAKSAA